MQFYELQEKYLYINFKIRWLSSWSFSPKSKKCWNYRPKQMGLKLRRHMQTKP